MTSSNEQLVPVEQALLPCPFCGGPATTSTTRATEDHIWFGAECLKCGLELSMKTKADAIAAWNTRTPPAVEPSCTCLTELEDDAYAPGGPMSGVATNQTTDAATVDIVERLLNHFDDCPEKGGERSITRPLVAAAADEIETLRAQLTAATRRAEQLEAEETCPCCEGKPMGPGEGCIAGCRDGVVFTTTANVLRNVLPWLHSADRRAEQAERMLAERDAALQLTRESLCKVERMLAEAVQIIEPFAAGADARKKDSLGNSVYYRQPTLIAARDFLATIRSAASPQMDAIIHSSMSEDFERRGTLDGAASGEQG